jgi:7,8-dihydro-6-hydroxymethylpterin dimethyltransferase
MKNVEQPLIKERTVSSLCPTCLKVINARIFQEGEAVLIDKRCEEHGDFRDTYWSDVTLYERFMSYWIDGSGIDGSSQARQGCPFDCGICENHKTGTLLGNIDVTSRCNLSCPVCFADAGDSSNEPTMDQLRAMMQILRDQKPVPCSAIQFSGGEPTMRDDLPEIVALARQFGFFQIQVATNGMKLASSPNLCGDLVRNGLTTIYLQFDGVTPEPYKTLRGRDLLPMKYQAIENLRAAKQMSIVLVPTLAKGVNDGQVGDIVKFAFSNSDVVKGVNFQPISFAGRSDQMERAKKRITIPDILALLEDQTDNEITRDDFYPVPFVAPISSLISAETGVPQPSLTVHPCCGAGTYVYRVNGRMIPITRFVDVEGLMESIKEVVQDYDGSRLGRLRMNGMILKGLPKFIDESRTPGSLNLTGLLLSVFRDGTWESLTEFHNNSLFLGIMHFQDSYNMDLERLQRCGIHYILPDGRIIPFCSYNTVHRSRLQNNQWN